MPAGRPRKHSQVYDTNIRVSKYQVRKLKGMKEKGEVYGDIIQKLLYTYDAWSEMMQRDKTTERYMSIAGNARN